MELGRWESRLDPEVRRFLYEGQHRLRDTQAALAALLGGALPESSPGSGPVGVDAMIVRLPDGALYLMPLVEINPRFTMGRVGLALSRRLHPGSGGRWEIITRHAARRAGYASLTAYADAVERPLQLAEGRWVEGTLFTNDPTSAGQFLGMATITPTRAQGQTDASSR